MKKEGENFDGMMTEAEMEYLSAKEEVKTISKKLVNAERAFTLVRERIEKLVSRYEAMLRKIETESFAGTSSVFTAESSHHSEFDSSEYWERVEQMWARRAKRAEVHAEIAARETLLAKEKTRNVREDKIKEIALLQKKLDELQSESSGDVAAEEQAEVAKRLQFRESSASPREANPSSLNSSSRMSKDKLDEVKQRFRDRMSARKSQYTTPSNKSGRAPLYPTTPKKTKQESPPTESTREILRSAGEEMCQQMDFYERSLKAVDCTRVYP
jgi:hypothetical protein